MKPFETTAFLLRPLLYSHLCPSPSASALPRSSIVSPSASAPQMDETLRDDCVFCLIIHGQSPAFKLYEDDMCLCILDTRPLCRWHSLIIPKSHFSSLDAIPPYEHSGGSCDVFKSAFSWQCNHESYWFCMSRNSFNLLVNNGAAAGQVIFHTHIHIIPRKAGDCLWTSESLHRRPLKIDPETSGLADHVRELLRNISEERKDQVSTLS